MLAEFQRTITLWTLGQRFAEELQALATQLRGHGAEASDVPAGICKARHKSSPDRIRDSRYHDRDCLGRLFRGQRGRCIDGEDHVNPAQHEIARQVTEPLVSVPGKLLVDDRIPSFDVA